MWNLTSVEYGVSFPFGHLMHQVLQCNSSFCGFPHADFLFFRTSEFLCKRIANIEKNYTMWAWKLMQTLITCDLNSTSCIRKGVPCNTYQLDNCNCWDRAHAYKNRYWYLHTITESTNKNKLLVLDNNKLTQVSRSGRSLSGTSLLCHPLDVTRLITVQK